MVSYKLSNEYCDDIINHLNDLVEDFQTFDRKYKRFIIHQNNEEYKYLWNDIDLLIKNNFGNNHYLSIWIIVLRYDVGDYFLPHMDRYNQDDDRYLSGGVELSNKSDFEGGEFIVNNLITPFERGKLITHKVTELHEIKPIISGTRWSLHFGINKSKSLV
jgi:hypothetical protein